jgi:hypothetical protein
LLDRTISGYWRTRACSGPCSGLWLTLERARPEVAHVVDLVALEQRRDAATVGWARWNTQQQVTVPQRLVVDREVVWS